MSYFPLPCEDQSEAGVESEVLVYELLSLTLWCLKRKKLWTRVKTSRRLVLRMKRTPKHFQASSDSEYWRSRNASSMALPRPNAATTGGLSCTVHYIQQRGDSAVPYVIYNNGGTQLYRTLYTTGGLSCTVHYIQRGGTQLYRMLYTTTGGLSCTVRYIQQRGDSAVPYVIYNTTLLYDKNAHTPTHYIRAYFLYLIHQLMTSLHPPITPIRRKKLTSPTYHTHTQEEVDAVPGVVD